ncbi:ABC1 protein [Besnoitia besnoiti]|uniref:ABC1 protein n=1 Tax=Besnoitia besnoiti TaxID=94643 RepID=A0A2A9MFX8_BESBE|nr:ABC1 protein [Besnoitia besnoiti]PFH34497.1 ABC1 protein [Besnoitia besnoiti]
MSTELESKPDAPQGRLQIRSTSGSSLPAREQSADSSGEAHDSTLPYSDRRGGEPLSAAGDAPVSAPSRLHSPPSSAVSATLLTRYGPSLGLSSALVPTPSASSGFPPFYSLPSASPLSSVLPSLSPPLFLSTLLPLLSSAQNIKPETLRQALVAAFLAAGAPPSAGAPSGVSPEVTKLYLSSCCSTVSGFLASLLGANAAAARLEDPRNVAAHGFVHGSDSGAYRRTWGSDASPAEKDFRVELLELLARRLLAALATETDPLRRRFQVAVTTLLVEPVEWQTFDPALYRARQKESTKRNVTSNPSAFQASLYVPTAATASPFAGPSPGAAGAGVPADAKAGAFLAAAAKDGVSEKASQKTRRRPEESTRPPSPSKLEGAVSYVGEGRDTRSAGGDRPSSVPLESADIRLLRVLSERLEQQGRLLEMQMRRIQTLEKVLASLEDGTRLHARGSSNPSLSSSEAPPPSLEAPPSSAASAGPQSLSTSLRDDSPAPPAARGSSAAPAERREKVLRERLLPSTPLWRFFAFSTMLLQLVSAASLPAARTFLRRLRLLFSRRKPCKEPVSTEVQSGASGAHDHALGSARGPDASGDTAGGGLAGARAAPRARCGTEAAESGRDSAERAGGALKASADHAGLSVGQEAGPSSSGARVETRARNALQRSLAPRVDAPKHDKPVAVSGVGVIDQVLNDERVASLIADRMCRMRGAALKLMQMVSMIEGSLPPVLTEALKKTRDSADIMPEKQLTETLVQELGLDWRRNFASFSLRPFAAASIGQVHRAALADGQAVAVKIQFPGVASSISADLRNLKTLVQWTRLLPRSLFLDVLCDEMRAELLAECDYSNEMAFYQHFRQVLHRDFGNAFYVPQVFPSCSTKKILVTEFISGLSLEEVGQQMSQEVRDSLAERLVRLVLAEIFLYRLMNTDPNPSNFFYLPERDALALIDFGAGRMYDAAFIDKYLQLLHAAVEERAEVVRRLAGELGFFGGSSSPAFLHAQGNVFLAFALCFRPPPAGASGLYSFKDSEIFPLLHKEMQTVMKNRERPPPPEIYSLHRKLAGCFLLCAEMKGRADTAKAFQQVIEAYRAPDGGPFRPAEDVESAES